MEKTTILLDKFEQDLRQLENRLRSAQENKSQYDRQMQEAQRLYKAKTDQYNEELVEATRTFEKVRDDIYKEQTDAFQKILALKASIDTLRSIIDAIKS